MADNWYYMLNCLCILEQAKAMGVSDNDSEIKPHYENFYNTFAGTNSPFGIVNVFVFEFFPKLRKIIVERSTPNGASFNFSTIFNISSKF